MSKIIIIRHGETIEGLKNILLGQKDGTLSYNGRKQLSYLAEKLKKYKIETIISSDLNRAYESAGIIAKELKIDDIKIENLICERSAGVYEGQSEAKVDWESYEKNELPYRKHKDGESFSEVEQRIVPFVDKMWKFEKNTLIVTHSVVIHMIIKIIQKNSLEEALKVDIKDTLLIVDTKDGSVTLVTVD